jgi:hypothetical protein
MNVLREVKDANLGFLVSGVIPVGQIGLNATTNISAVDGLWPFIQLYSLNPTGNVIVQYNKGGGVQSTTLTFDTVDQFAGAELDRVKYTQGSEVHVTVTDLWLNIDPTDEDSWTFGADTTNSTTNYQVFDENGNRAGDAVFGGTIDISTTLGNLMCEDNCILLLDTDAQVQEMLSLPFRITTIPFL